MLCRFVVLGSTKKHYLVTLSNKQHSCQCIDFRIRKHECKHIRCASAHIYPTRHLEAGCSANASSSLPDLNSCKLILTQNLCSVCRLVLTQLDVAENPGAWHKVGSGTFTKSNKGSETLSKCFPCSVGWHCNWTIFCGQAVEGKLGKVLPYEGEDQLD